MEKEEQTKQKSTQYLGSYNVVCEPTKDILTMSPEEIDEKFKVRLKRLVDMIDRYKQEIINELRRPLI
ncbi:MAG: hypothetical protein WC045_02430 [Patescibacteria group bacterium]